MYKLGSTRVLNKMTPKRPTPRHITIKMPKLKTKNLKNPKRKAVSYLQGAPIKLSADLSKESFQARKDWQEIFKVITRKDLQPRLLYSSRLSSK